MSTIDQALEIRPQNKFRKLRNLVAVKIELFEKVFERMQRVKDTKSLQKDGFYRGIGSMVSYYETSTN